MRFLIDRVNLDGSGNSTRLKVLLICASLLGAGCGRAPADGVTTTESALAATVVSLAITPPSAAVPRTVRQQFKATLKYSNGKTKSGATGVSWSVSNLSLASVDATGLVTALAPGTVAVRATYTANGVFGQSTLTITPATLVSVSVSPANKKLAIAATATLKATGTFSDGTTFPLAGAVVWSSTAPAIASVDSNGVVTGLAAGTAAITAKHTDTGLLAKAAVTVGTATLASVALTPPAPSVPNGLTVPYVAMGTYSDGSTADVTSAATWASSNAAVAAVSNTTDSAGQATAASVGTTTITATLGGKKAKSTLTVTTAILSSIAITPSPVKVPKGTTQPLTATGIYSDHTTQNVTALVTWSSSGAPASVSNAAGSNGLLTAVSLGTVTVTATDATTGVSATAPVTVTPAILVALSIAPPAATTPLGLTQQFSVTGTYSDSTTRDATAAVTWTSTSPSIAAVSNDPASTGLVTTLAVGTTIINASDPVTKVSVGAAFTVTAAVLRSISVNPPTATVPNGLTQQFSAIGIYSDNSHADITPFVSWSVPSGSATISNAAGSIGLATTNGVGANTIKALDPTTGVVGTSQLTVIKAALVSLEVTPALASVPLGTTQQFTAMGLFTDGTAKDLTTCVTWSADNGNATLSNVAGSQGLATGAQLGPATVTATHPASGITGTTTLTVTPWTLQRIQIDPPVLQQLVVGQSVQFRATGISTPFPHVTVKDLTGTVTWTSSNPGVYAIVNGSSGRALHTGSAFVTATDPVTGIRASVSVTVVGPVLRLLVVSPSSLAVPLGYSGQLSVVGTFSDSSQQDLTSVVTWTSSGPAAFVSNSADQPGQVTTTDVGTVTVTATDPSTGVHASATVQVTPAVLTAIAIDPDIAQVPAGRTQQFIANGTFSDGSVQDVTGSVTWLSDSPSATVSNAPDSVGLATGMTPGGAIISATDPATGISGSVGLTTTAAVVLQSLGVSPPAPNIRVGMTAPLQATGIFSDGSSLDMTNLVTWTSTAPSVAAVSNVAGSIGLVTGLGQGAATVTGTDPATGIAASASVTVTPAVVVSMRVSPSVVTLFTGQRQQMTVSATKSDGTTVDYTQSVAWSSSGSAVFVSNAPWSYGTVTGQSAGGATVTATDRASGVTATATVSVSLQTSDGLPEEFSSDVNPAGDWAYGAAPTVGGPVTQFSALSLNTSTNQAFWFDSAGTRLYYNGGSQEELITTSSPNVGSYVDPGQMALSPNNGEQAVVRWTAPTTGAYQASATFTAANDQQQCQPVQVCQPEYYSCSPYTCYYSCGFFQTCSTTCWNTCQTFSCYDVQQCSYPVTSANVAVLANGGTKFSAQLNGGSTHYTGSVFVHAGDTIDFEVGRGNSPENAVLLNAAVTAGATCASIAQSGPGQLVGLVVTPAAVNVTGTGTTSFRAMAYYSNQPRTPVDVTAQATWGGSGTVVNGIGSMGAGTVGYGAGPGTGSVTALLGGLSASAALRVWDPARVAQMTGLTMAAGTLGPGGSVWNTAHGACYPISASVTYADGTSEDVTATTVWGGGQPVLFGNLLTINSDGSDSYFDITASLGGGFPSVSQTIGVWSARFAVSCADSRIPGAAWNVSVSAPTTAPAVGQATQLAATANYADGSLRDASSVASWTTCNAGTADVSSDGWLTGLAPGTAVVFANVAGQAGGVSINVQPAPTTGKVTALYIQPTADNLVAGTSAPARAVATYDNLGNTLFNVTPQATFATTDGTIVAVAPGASAWAMTATAGLVGKAVLSASYGGLTANANVRSWDAARLGHITSTSLGLPNSFPPNCDVEQFSLTASFTDGTTEDVSWSTQWSPIGTSNPYLFVSPKGLVTLVGNPNGYIYVTGSMGRGIDQPQSGPIGWWNSCPGPSCSDGIRNGGESAVDCGGQSCGACTSGQACDAPSDCSDGTCLGSVCQ